MNSFLSNSKVRLAPSGLHGIGVFSAVAIGKDELVFGDMGRKWKRIRVSNIKNKGVRELISELCVVENGMADVPYHGMSCCTMDFYLNHSDTPNVSLVPGKENFVALRRIRKGEELTFDYSEIGHQYLSI